MLFLVHFQIGKFVGLSSEIHASLGTAGADQEGIRGPFVWPKYALPLPGDKHWAGEGTCLWAGSF